MRLERESGLLLGELADWSWRGALCALPSFVIALKIGYRSIEEIGAILLGTMLYVVVAALLCRFGRLRRTPTADSWVRAFKSAALVKSFAPVALLAPLGLVVEPDGWAISILLMFLLDAALSAVSVLLTVEISGKNMEDLAWIDSPAWTLVSTLINGALLAVVLIGLAVMIYVATCGASGGRLRTLRHDS